MDIRTMQIQLATTKITPIEHRQPMGHCGAQSHTFLGQPKNKSNRCITPSARLYLIRPKSSAARMTESRSSEISQADRAWERGESKRTPRCRREAERWQPGESRRI
jgi:hypothetical protein